MIPFWCILFSIVVTYLAKLPVAWAMSRAGGYDNRTPRDQQQKLTGWGKRAVAAHQNCFEAFPIFASCVFIAHLTNSDPTLSAALSIAFVVSRILYVIFYLIDWPTLRSTVWFAGLALCFALALI